MCEDGLRENDINFAVASKVVLALRQRGYSVLLLDEFDPRLEDFQAAALVSTSVWMPRPQTVRVVKTTSSIG